MPLEIRPEEPSEFALVESIHAAAFDGPHEAGVVANVRASSLHNPAWSLVGLLDGQTVGHVLFSRVGLEDANHMVRPVVVLAPLAVHPDAHGHGVGTALVKAGLARIESDGEPLVVVRGKPSLYARFGFVASERLNVHPPFELAPGEYQALRLRSYSNALVGTVRYPKAFEAVGYPVQYGEP